jgi:phage-related protein
MSVDLTYEVSYNTSKQPMNRFLENQFGDGYRQYTLDGINYDEETWNVNFKPLSQTDANNLEYILLNSIAGTVNYLRWTPPAESNAKYFTANNITKLSVGPQKWVISCQLKREFPLV